MLRVGLTGGIGAGKSTVATRLAEHGAVLIDADQIARQIVEPGAPALEEIVAEFGEDVRAADGRLDRAALAASAFADDAARQRLNAIMHPRIGERTAELLAAAHGDAIVVHDIPLLVEGGLAPSYHLVIVVDAPEDVRVRRLMEARGMGEADARARIAAQATEAQRRAVADVWLDNSGAVDEIESDVDSLWADRLVPFEANVRLHRHANPGPPRVVPPDPSWPQQAERLIERIRAAAGQLARRVDHIGSTAVDSLPAKDILDIQLTVSALEDADHIGGRLAEAGFPRYPGVVEDQPHPPDDDRARWLKRYHNSADPGRPVNLHVRAEGSPAWRLALLFPAWMRADDEARAEYAALKRRLAEQFSTDAEVAGYAAAKEPWFADAWPRAEAWAEQVGWTP